MLSCDLLTVAALMTSFVISVTKGMPMDLDPEDYEVLADNEPKSDNKGITISRLSR
jgi:hypothetical protein